MRYLEDVVVGTRFTSAPHTLTEAEIIDYCTQWDPLPFHIDPAAAAKTPMGKLFTSALHTMAIGSRLLHDLKRPTLAVIAGLGLDEIRMHHPVFVDDTIHVRVEIYEAQPTRSDPNRGVVRYDIQIFNQDDVKVLSYRSAVLVFGKDHADAPKPG